MNKILTLIGQLTYTVR